MCFIGFFFVSVLILSKRLPFDTFNCCLPKSVVLGRLLRFELSPANFEN